MARVAQYTKALPVYDTPEMKERIKDIADRAHVSMAEVIRWMHNHSIEAAAERFLGGGH